MLFLVVKEYTGCVYQQSHHLFVLISPSFIFFTLFSCLVLTTTCGTMSRLRVEPLWFHSCGYVSGLFGSSDTRSFVPIFIVDVQSIVSNDYISR